MEINLVNHPVPQKLFRNCFMKSSDGSLIEVLVPVPLPTNKEESKEVQTINENVILPTKPASFPGSTGSITMITPTPIIVPTSLTKSDASLETKTTSMYTKYIVSNKETTPDQKPGISLMAPVTPAGAYVPIILPSPVSKANQSSNSTTPTYATFITNNQNPNLNQNVKSFTSVSNTGTLKTTMAPITFTSVPVLLQPGKSKVVNATSNTIRKVVSPNQGSANTPVRVPVSLVSLPPKIIPSITTKAPPCSVVNVTVDNKNRVISNPSVTFNQKESKLPQQPTTAVINLQTLNSKKLPNQPEMSKQTPLIVNKVNPSSISQLNKQIPTVQVVKVPVSKAGMSAPVNSKPSTEPLKFQTLLQPSADNKLNFQMVSAGNGNNYRIQTMQQIKINNGRVQSVERIPITNVSEKLSVTPSNSVVKMEQTGILKNENYTNRLPSGFIYTCTPNNAVGIKQTGSSVLSSTETKASVSNTAFKEKFVSNILADRSTQTLSATTPKHIIITNNGTTSASFISNDALKNVNTIFVKKDNVNDIGTIKSLDKITPVITAPGTTNCVIKTQSSVTDKTQTLNSTVNVLNSIKVSQSVMDSLNSGQKLAVTLQSQKGVKNAHLIPIQFSQPQSMINSPINQMNVKVGSAQTNFPNNGLYNKLHYKNTSSTKQMMDVNNQQFLKVVFCPPEKNNLFNNVNRKNGKYINSSTNNRKDREYFSPHVSPWQKYDNDNGSSQEFHDPLDLFIPEIELIEEKGKTVNIPVWSPERRRGNNKKKRRYTGRTQYTYVGGRYTSDSSDSEQDEKPTYSISSNKRRKLSKVSLTNSKISPSLKECYVSLKLLRNDVIKDGTINLKVITERDLFLKNNVDSSNNRRWSRRRKILKLNTHSKEAAHYAAKLNTRKANQLNILSEIHNKLAKRVPKKIETIPSDIKNFCEKLILPSADKGIKPPKSRIEEKEKMKKEVLETDSDEEDLKNLKAKDASKPISTTSRIKLLRERLTNALKATEEIKRGHLNVS